MKSYCTAASPACKCDNVTFSCIINLIKPSGDLPGLNIRLQKWKIEGQSAAMMLFWVFVQTLTICYTDKI